MTIKSPPPILLVFLISILAGGEGVPSGNRKRDPAGHFVEHVRRIQSFKASLPVSPPSPSPSTVSPPQAASRVYSATAYGGDPTGKTDSTEALLAAIADAVKGPTSIGEGHLLSGIADLGGARLTLEGGKYLISRPLRLPSAGVGNLVIHGGTLQASDDFPTGGYLIDLSAPATNSSSSTSSSSYDYEFITLRDLLLDANYRGGGVLIANALRTGVDSCYVTGFATTGVRVSGGHETYIRNSFLGQHITAGGDPGERNFSGTAIELAGNDNAVTDVVIFSAAVGVLVSGQANSLSGVHCYNKAAGFGGTGIHLKLPGNTQTRILNCYLDYTGIVAEDPVQLLVAGSFFLGDANVVFRSVNGVVAGVNVIDNIFSGSGNGVDIVRLEGPFEKVDDVVVERNNARGMNLKSTAARKSAAGNGSVWTVDFGSVLLFPDRIRHVQYTLSAGQGMFPSHALRNASSNRVVIEASAAVQATVFVTVDQSGPTASLS